MTTINNDHSFKLALDSLNRIQQRILGGQFVARVLELTLDSRVQRAVAVAICPEVSPVEWEDAFRAAKAVAVSTYTDCGKDTDWLAQAAHFVAAAAAACLMPAAPTNNDNPAWKAAMQARMARNCELIEKGDGGEHNEAESQYQITADFLLQL